ncbi:chorismate synthase [Lutispora saccharofermentans]|uniref:Chorismate synthase n=1 Tax=Lutispora saccharofermentans TaxID=3024236 RepID=A0ABT1NMZ1_9FIRM|nr:chorismate synthase [Lutispora saccharofermentans]MCQ1531301.1 chorismate synthase [Lutispora saccharofermentans]
MSGIWGKSIRLSIFGESHGKAIGINIDGLPPGFEIDIDGIKQEMARRAPGKSILSTSRAEEDEFEIISGFFEGRTTGAPLCAIIKNTDSISAHYSEMQAKMRPGHADYTGYVKYKGFNDYRGGGHFSGRLTAPLVFAGAIARQMLEKRGVIIGSHIKSIGSVQDEAFDPVNIDAQALKSIRDKVLPVIDDQIGEKMKEAVLAAMEQADSLGGIIECAAVNVPEGLGDPFFDSVESSLSHLLFSIPSVKGVEFGAGFDIAYMRGSEANDELYIKDGIVKTYTNNNGGILGGITCGMPLVFRAAIKPTPSIGREQRTVDIKGKKNTSIQVSGRHDPCIVSRAVPVVEAAAALVLLDFMLFESRVK